MDRTLVFGTFDSESLWRDDAYGRLPAVHDPERALLVSCMDELLFPLCGPDDGLLTRYPIAEAQTDYLGRLGFAFEPIAAGGSGTADRLRAFRRALPYAILADTERFCAAHGLEATFPRYDIVRLVNSKLYSARLARRLELPCYSSLADSADELAALGRELLDGRGAVLIKDPYGVAGKGNLLVRSVHNLDNIAAYLRRQERAGKVTRLLLEPFLDVARDFSCQFEVERDGRVRSFGVQELANRQFAYAGSRSMEEQERAALESMGYFAAMARVADSLRSDGYYGHVCVDSMLLADGMLVPVVEINARVSMGLINARLDRALGRRGELLFVSVGYRDRMRYEELLAALRDRELLYPNRRGTGAVPLSSATLTAAGDTADGPIPAGSTRLYKGRWYMTVIAEEEAERTRIREGVKRMLGERGAIMYG